MEAVPKLPMLTFDLKVSPDNGNFLEIIRKLIKIAYNEDPDSFAKELEEISKLRSNSCIRPKEDVTGVAEIKRYYSQLYLLQNRFKIESGDKGPFNFSWNDPYSGTIYTLPDFDYELASVLYNLGSLHSILGAAEKRDTSESMKVACTHYQCAAWAFHTLPDRYPNVYTPDISPDLMAVMSQICLAQAQECILEKSILDHRKSSIISKVGAQVSDYYFAALHKLETSNARHLTSDILLLGGAPPGEETVMESIGHKNNNKWIRQIEFKFVYHKAVAHLYEGLNSEEAQKMGERITHFQASLDKLMECAKLATSTAKDCGIWKEAVTFSNDVIKGKLDNSKKENEFIYHEKVPELDTLIELKGASLVKGIGFEIADPEVSGSDIFIRLVPLEAHEASSLYSEEKAKLLRVIGEEIESRNNELAVFMSSMSLDEDGVVPKPDEQIALPQELIEVAASLSVKGEDNVTVHLKNAMSRIAAVSAEVETSLKEIRDTLKDNEEQEKEYAKIMSPEDEKQMNKGGGREHITEEISRECEKFEGAHKMASDSNSTLHNAIRLHMDNLKLLTLPLDKLQKEIPSMADLDEESEANVAEVRRILSKVEEMKVQRLQLENSFRRQVMDDDITKKLVLHKDKKLPEVFEIELKKHDKAKKVLKQNLLAQANIMKALTEVNAKYVDTRRIISELSNSRNEMIGSLVASFYAHEDLLHKAAKGLEFYDKLDSNVTKLLHRVEGVVNVHQEERDAILAKCAPLPSKNIGDGNTLADKISSYYPYAPPMTNMDNIPAIGQDSGLMPVHSPITAPSNIGGVGSYIGGNDNIERISPEKATGSNSGKPTLKDYLKIMKETKNDASAAYAAINYPEKTPEDENINNIGNNIQTYSSLPSVRPPPVGSESIEAPSYVHQTHPNVIGTQQPIPLQDVQSDKQMLFNQQHNTNPSYLHQQSTNMSYNPVQYGSQSIQPTIRYPSMPATSSENNRQSPSANLTVAQTNYSSVPTTEINALNKDTNKFHVHAQGMVPHNVANLQVQPTLSYPLSYQHSANTSGYYTHIPQTNQLPNSQATNFIPPHDSAKSIGYSTISAPASTSDPGLYQLPGSTPYSTSYVNSSTVQTLPHSLLVKNQTFPTNVAQPNFQHQQQYDSYNYLQGTHSTPYAYRPNMHVGAANNQIRAVPFNHSDKNSPQQPMNIINQGMNQYGHQSFTGQNNTLGNPITSCDKQANFQIPPSLISSANSVPQYVSTVGYPPSYTTAPKSNLASVAVNQAVRPVFQPNSTSSSSPAIGIYNKQSIQNPSTVISSATNMPQHVSNFSYPQAHTTMPQNNPPPAVVNQAIQPHLQHIPVSVAPQAPNMNPLNSEIGPSRPIYSNCSMEVQQPIQSYQSTTEKASNYLSYANHPASVPHGQYIQRNLKSTGDIITSSVQNLPPNVHGASQITYPNVPINPNINTQIQNAYQQIVPFEPSLVPKSDFRMKPIVPQPGTTPNQPNVSSNMNCAINVPQQVNATSMVILPNEQHQNSVNMAQIGLVSTPSVRRSSSFDDMLNTELDDTDGSSSVITLQPKVMTPMELAEQKRQAKAFKDIVKATNHDPYENEKTQKMLLEDVNIMKNRISSASNGNNQMWLNEKWKIFNTFVTAGSVGTGDLVLGGGALSVARCYPMKNRAPDVLPFDSSRVELPTTKDDYINASHIRHLSPHAPNFIATQWPPANTHNDFWTMVWQEEIEIIVCLLSEPPTLKDIYWPTERKEPLKIVNSSSSRGPTAPSLDITLQSMKLEEGKMEDGKPTTLDRTERILTVLNRATNTSRVVIHIQLEVNANSSGRILIESLSDLSTICLAYHRQQRVLTHPILSHCLDGSGRTASFVLMVAAISEIDVASGTNTHYDSEKPMPENILHDPFKIMPDLVKMAALMAQQRKGILRERHHFKHAYEGMLSHGRSILFRKGVLKAADANIDNNALKPQNIITIHDEIQPKYTKGITCGDDQDPQHLQLLDASENQEISLGKREEEVTHKSTQKALSPANFFPAELLTNNLSDLNLSDPLGLMTSSDSPHKKRITKQDFLNASNSSLSKIGNTSTDGNDPLSQLDPLWSMK